MISFDDARRTVLAERRNLETEEIALAEALGRFLSAPVVSPIDAPPFDKASMDGFAVAGDEARYRVRDIVAAGDEPPASGLSPGEAVKIMTGAPVPPGTDRVIRVEFTRQEGEMVEVLQPEPHQNIIRRAENIRAGDPLLDPVRLGPKEIGCLAAAGFSSVHVYRTLLAGVITTGNEIRPAGQPLGSGDIYDSNGPQLTAQVRAAGMHAIPYGIVGDDRGALAEAVARGIAECDVLLLSGGVSKGDFDYVPQVLEHAGVAIRFHRVQVKPGRPTLFGRAGDTMVFGLPGNPVSTYVIFEVLVRPLLHRIQGVPEPGTWVHGRLSTAISRTDTERVEFYPALVGIDGEAMIVRPLRYGGSSHLNALAGANALLSIPAGTSELLAGTAVRALLLEE